MYREQSPRREALGTIGIRMVWILCLSLSFVLGLAVISGKL